MSETNSQVSFETGSVDTQPDTVITPMQAAEFNLAYNNSIRANTALPIDKRRAAQQRSAEMADVLEILDYAEASGNSVSYLLIATKRGIGDLDIEKLEKAQEFAEQDYSFLQDSTPYKVWQRDKQVKAAEQSAKAAERRERVQKETRVTASRAELARTLLVSEVLKGGVAVSTDFAAEYAPRQSAGFAVATEAKRDESVAFEYSKPFELGSTFLDSMYGDKGIYEGVIFKPLTKAEYRQVQVPGRKKLFGAEPATTKHEFTGTRPLQTSELVDGSTDEPAVEMLYRTFGDTSYREDTAYKVHDGRNGNYLAVSIVMPQSVAAKLEQAAKSNPIIMRDVVEGAVLINMGISEKAWRNGDEHTKDRPMRPPYEKWAQANGGQTKMYFQEPGLTSFDASRALPV